jgi:phosphatidate cytidylyltransferase
MNLHVGKDVSVAFQNPFKPNSMLRERVAIIILLLPLVAWVVADGGWLFTGAVAIVLAFAAREYAHLFRNDPFRPSSPLLVFGTFLLALSRYWGGIQFSASVLTLLCLLVMVWHLIDFEKGAPRSGTDFAITLAGIVYLGWIGSYLISLRTLMDGLWWFFIALPSVWFADAAAFFVGRWIGRHRLAPKLSPKKTWEGYLAGIFAGALSGLLLALLWRVGAGTPSSITPVRGVIVGLILSVLAPFGDLGVSMIKREIQVKDTGNLLPGHGGALDRLDTWIWAGVLGYILIPWLVNG